MGQPHSAAAPFLILLSILMAALIIIDPDEQLVTVGIVRSPTYTTPITHRGPLPTPYPPPCLAVSTSSTRSASLSLGVCSTAIRFPEMM